jgi:3',5'-cyclic AMP phosphodiesterase CpdA
VVITGDLVDSGAEAQYRHLRELLAPLRCPYHLMPGNHDDRDTLRRHPQVESVICAHQNRSIQARYTLEPPGYLIHTWRGGRLVSHLAHSRIDSPPEPF